MNAPFRLLAVGAVVAAGLPWVATAEAGPLSIIWGAQGEGGALASADGRELPPGCLVRLGFFNLPMSQVQEAAFDPAYLDTAFVELAQTTIGQFDGQSFEVAGSFAHTLAADSLQLPSRLAQRPMCIWVSNAATVAEATEIGIFTSTNWQLTYSQIGSVIWDVNQVEADGMLVGSFSPTQSPTLGGQMNQLAPVTELWDNSDLDRDGVSALLEDAFGMDPDVPDSELMPALAPLGTADGLGYFIRRPAGGTQLSAVVYQTPDFRYTIEVSNDLQSWRVDPAACRLHASKLMGNGFETATLEPVPTLGQQPDFFRVKVERLQAQ